MVLEKEAEWKPLGVALALRGFRRAGWQQLPRGGEGLVEFLE